MQQYQPKHMAYSPKREAAYRTSLALGLSTVLLWTSPALAAETANSTADSQQQSAVAAEAASSAASAAAEQAGAATAAITTEQAATTASTMTEQTGEAAGASSDSVTDETATTQTDGETLSDGKRGGVPEEASDAGSSKIVEDASSTSAMVDETAAETGTTKDDASSSAQTMTAESASYATGTKDDEATEKTVLDGIDISNYQSGIDTANISADFVIVKATEGTTYLSPSFKAQADAVLSSGKLLGIYHFARTGSTALAQAEYFVKTVKDYLGKAVLFLDWENTSYSDIRSEGTGWCKTWLDKVYALTGVRPLIYLNKSATTEYDFSDIASDYGLWVAQYADMSRHDGYQEDPWTSSSNYGSWTSGPALFQYSSTTYLSGYNGALDVDKFYGSEENWKALAQSDGTQKEAIRYWQETDGSYYHYTNGKVDTGWLVTDVSPFKANVGLQRYWLGQDGVLQLSQLLSAEVAGYWAYARPEGYVVRGRWTDTTTGYVYLADNDGRLEDPGWHVTAAYSPTELRRYWVDEDAHACIPGYSEKGYPHYTLSEGQVLRGKATIGSGVALADNNGLVETTAGWLVTSRYDGHLERYWMVQQSSGLSLAQTGSFSVEGSQYYGLAGRGYVLRNTASTLPGYWVIADNDGRVTTLGTLYLDVPYIDQYAQGAPEGCEAASLLMGLWYKGILTNVSYRQFLRMMPYASDGNPYHGFVGTPYANDGNWDTIMMPAVAAWGAQYDGNVRNITGCSMEELVYQLAQGNPVVVWTSYQFRSTHILHEWWGDYKTQNHVMTLIGFNPTNQSFAVADPYRTGKYWVSNSTFMNSWNVLRGAVTV